MPLDKLMRISYIFYIVFILLLLPLQLCSEFSFCFFVNIYILFYFILYLIFTVSSTVQCVFSSQSVPRRVCVICLLIYRLTIHDSHNDAINCCGD